jgi:hypothetical protein
MRKYKIALAAAIFSMIVLISGCGEDEQPTITPRQTETVTQTEEPRIHKDYKPTVTAPIRSTTTPETTTAPEDANPYGYDMSQYSDGEDLYDDYEDDFEDEDEAEDYYDDYGD